MTFKLGVMFMYSSYLCICISISKDLKIIAAKSAV